MDIPWISNGVDIRGISESMPVDIPRIWTHQQIELLLLAITVIIATQ